MIRWRSLEVRLAAWYSLLLFAGYLALAVALWFAVRLSVSAAVDDLLAQRFVHLVDYVVTEADDEDEREEEFVEYALAVPEGHLIQVRAAGGRPVVPVEDRDSPVAWRDPEAGRLRYETAIAGVPYRVLVDVAALGDERYAVLMASSLGSLIEVQRRLIVVAAVATPIALLFAVGGGYYTARRALQPVDDIAATAAAITVSNLSARLAVPATGDALERLSRTLNAMFERLDVAVRRIEQFSADASHELRTPLALIRTTADLAVRHGRTTEEYRRDLESIRVEAERLTELIDALLALARNGAASPGVAMAAVDLGAVVADARRQLDAAARASATTLTVVLPDGPLPVTGHDAALRRLVAELVENAIAHAPGGTVTIAVGADGGDVRLEVRDDGEGIAADDLPRIFDRFYRGDRVRAPGSGRYGLGLAIVRQIAELHRADVTVDSRPGAGATFAVRFPRRTEGAST